MQTCVPLHARATTAGHGSHHKHSLRQSASEQMTRAGEGTSTGGGFAARNGQAIFRARVGTWTISKQEGAHMCRKKVQV